MLSLVTHEPHFCLLREIVSFTGNNRGQPARETIENPSEDTFIVFQVGMLREYLDLELRNDAMSFAFDLENAIDDFVLFCMLVGNDFLPALPTLDIGEGGLNTILNLYRELLPQMGGYITSAGKIHHHRLEMLFAAFGQHEATILRERALDADDHEEKKRKRDQRDARAGLGGGGNENSNNNTVPNPHPHPVFTQSSPPSHHHPVIITQSSPPSHHHPVIISQSSSPRSTPRSTPSHHPHTPLPTPLQAVGAVTVPWWGHGRWGAHPVC
jgi:hypothetical protein